MSASLVVQSVLKDLIAGCCPDKVYVVVYSHDHSQALKYNGTTYNLAAYTAATHADFGIILPEHTQRSSLYRKEFLAAELNLPANADGEMYHVEIWYRATTSTFARSDSMLDTYDFHWKAEGMVLTPISLIQSQSFAGIRCNLSTSYDSELDQAQILAWMDRGGVLVTDAVSCEVTWLYANGNPIATAMMTSAFSNIPGFFTTTLTGFNLEPDIATAIKVRIRDADGVDHESGTSVVTWD